MGLGFRGYIEIHGDIFIYGNFHKKRYPNLGPNIV